MTLFSSARDLHQSLLEKLAHFPEYKQNTSTPYATETFYTLLRLERILRNYTSQSMHATLIDFFKERWNWIKNTDVQYCHDFNNPANIMCIEIAKALSATVHKPYLLLLMPTLAVIPESNYLTSSYEDDLDLKEIILSDDNQRLICVTDVLSFAKEDGILKFNSLFETGTQELGIGEHHRLLSRHLAVHHYFQAIQDKLNFVLHGENAGAYVKRLIIGLREGGAKKKGSEKIAGEDADIAIVDFDIFLNQLNRTQKNQLLNTGKFDRRMEAEPEWFTIRQSWQRLAHGKKIKATDTRYCVELIADDLEDILNDNPSLHQIVPFDLNTTANLQQLESNLSHCREIMTNALSASNPFDYYHSEQKPEFILDICSKVAKSTQMTLDVTDIAYFSRLYHQYKCPTEKTDSAIRNECKLILFRVRNHCPKNKIQQVLAMLPTEVVDDVKNLLIVQASNPSISNRYAFHGQTTLSKRNQDENSEGCKKKLKNNHAESLNKML